jgi:hypothetical protein
MGPRAGLDMVSTRKIPSPSGNRTPITQQILRGRSGKWNKQNVEERWKMHTKSQSENMKQTDHLGDLGIVGQIILKWILKK